MESWTQQAFKKDGNLVLQIIAAGFIFFQLFLNLLGSITGSTHMFAWFVAFYMLRLIQFFENTNLGVQALQSNLVSVTLCSIALFTVDFSGSSLATLAFIVALADAVLGTSIFASVHHTELAPYTKSIPSLFQVSEKTDKITNMKFN